MQSYNNSNLQSAETHSRQQDSGSRLPCVIEDFARAQRHDDAHHDDAHHDDAQVLNHTGGGGSDFGVSASPHSAGSCCFSDDIAKCLSSIGGFCSSVPTALGEFCNLVSSCLNSLPLPPIDGFPSLICEEPSVCCMPCECIVSIFCCVCSGDIG